MRCERVDFVLDDLLTAIGWEDAPRDRLKVHLGKKVLATPWPIAPIAAAVMGLVGLAISRIHEIRTGEMLDVEIEGRSAELSMASSSYLMIDGQPGKFRGPFTGFYEAKQGGWVYLHGNFPHLRDGLLAMLGVDNEPEKIKEAVRCWSTEDLESEAIMRGLCAARVRTREEWLSTAAARDPAAGPPIELQKISDGPLAELHAMGSEPLSGIRMLDLSRVIAGPMAGRTMAEHGAEVLLISAPHLPSIPSLVIDTGFGKRSAFLDLDQADHRQQLAALLAEADVYLDAYRPGSLAARGFSSQELTAMNPSLVSVSLSAFPAGSPWGERRGYDSVVQATVGMAQARSSDVPRLLPCQPLDYLTGYLAALAAMLGLIRRLEEGGRWHASLSLAATAEWMWRMRARLGDDAAIPRNNPEIGDVAGLYQVIASPFGELRALRPALTVGSRRMAWSPPAPLGTHGATWLP
jgi:crotonobetainyl-CoA:carnitine CoA-transferase CaiB-like acyl-CoA transferase